MTLSPLLVLAVCRTRLPPGRAYHQSLVAPWLERSTGIWEAMGSISVRDSDFFRYPTLAINEHVIFIKFQNCYFIRNIAMGSSSVASSIGQFSAPYIAFSVSGFLFCLFVWFFGWGEGEGGGNFNLQIWAFTS